MRATLPSSSSKMLASSSVVPTTTRKKRSAVRGGRTTIVKASSSSSAFSLFSFFKNREEEGEEERSSSSRSVHRKRCTHENESTTLDRAIRASQSMVCQSIGGFNFGAFFCNDVTAAFDDAEEEQRQQQRRQKVEEKRGRGILNERLVWREEDGYERQMRLATASFLAATTVAVGQPALALDFVVVDPSGAFSALSKISFLIQGKICLDFFSARVFSLVCARGCRCNIRMSF